MKLLEKNVRKLRMTLEMVGIVADIYDIFYDNF
jgi:hypothetical protein